MSSDITVSIHRGPVPSSPASASSSQIEASVPLQLDNMSTVEAAYFGGAAPYFRYKGYSDWIVDVEEGDLLIDLVNLEPRTNPPNVRTKQYRVISDPESFPDNHMEFVCDRMIGNTPS